MALLNDKRIIIKPISIKIDNIDNILENLIIHDNIIYNSYIFNHIIYSSTNENISIYIINNINIHINSTIKNQRIHFRTLNKKNKLDIYDFCNYFDKMYKLINKLNSMFHHIIPNNTHKYKKWGDNILWDYTINAINNILINDVIFKFTINNNIKHTDINSKNIQISKLNYYMNIFSEYIHNKEEFYNNFVDIIDSSFVDNINIINQSIINQLVNNNIINVNIFKRLYKYYMDYYSNYYYISKNHPFKKLKECITNNIKSIFESNNIINIKHFISIYNKELLSLIKHIDIKYILLSCSPSDIQTYISYFNTLYETFKDTELYNYIIECIKININSYFNKFDDFLYIADLINTDIINNKINVFYYELASFIKNKDDFIMIISQKFMERIIYTDINKDIEKEHQSKLCFIFKESPGLLKYNIIYNDYINSNEYNYDKLKIIITSLDTWKINHSIGYSNTIINTEEFTTQLCYLLFKYNQINNKTLIKKKLIMYPHLGCVEIEINKNIIKVLPAHMFCLELFVSFDTELPYDVIFNKVKQNMSNYSDEFIKKIIDSLIGPVLIKKNDILRIKTILEDTNMIDIFHSINNTKHIIINKMKEELCHDKIDIIMSNINHQIKKYEQINIDSLFENIMNSINIFEVNKDIFEKAITKMKQNDYIEVIDNKVKKIDY